MLDFLHAQVGKWLEISTGKPKCYT